LSSCFLLRLRRIGEALPRHDLFLERVLIERVPGIVSVARRCVIEPRNGSTLL
jgi:hypothetical protein